MASVLGLGLGVLFFLVPTCCGQVDVDKVIDDTVAAYGVFERAVGGITGSAAYWVVVVGVDI